MDILNILKSVVRICRFSLKMMTCCINITKFGTRLRKLNIKFHSEPIYDKKYIKVKVREYDGMIKTNFLGDKVLNENKTSSLHSVIFIRLKSIKSTFSHKKHKKQTSDLHSVIHLKSIKSIKATFLIKIIKYKQVFTDKQVFADTSNNRQTSFFS